VLSVIIHAGSDAERLARTIGSLVPAIAEGIVGDGCVVAGAMTPEMDAVADAAGCNVVTGQLHAALPEALRTARGEHLLFLSAGSVLENGWWVEAAQFMQRSGAGTNVSAVFTYAVHEYGMAAATQGALRAALARLARSPLPGQGLIAHRGDVAGRIDGASFPPRTAGRIVFLRAKSYVMAHAR
jgi:hypothetical protein